MLQQRVLGGTTGLAGGRLYLAVDQGTKWKRADGWPQTELKSMEVCACCTSFCASISGHSMEHED